MAPRGALRGFPGVRVDGRALRAVHGLTEADGGWTTTVVGLLCLGIGFGILWNYFDFARRRPPRPGLGLRGLWLIVHLPLSMSIAAAGAGMVGLIEHATDDRTPNGTAWLLAAILAASLTVVWTESFVRHARLGVPFVEDAEA